MTDKYTPSANEEQITDDQEYELKMEMALERALYFDKLWFEHTIGEEDLMMCMQRSDVQRDDRFKQLSE